MNNSTDRFSYETPEAAFWTWFDENCERLAEEDAEPGEAFGELGEKLAEYHEGLVCEVTVEQDGVREFVISADGVRENFPAVRALAESAPAMSGWRVTAFRPRMEDYMACSCDYEGRTFDPKEIWFHGMVEEDGIDFIFYHPNYSEDERDLIAMGTYILLDVALGERDVVCGIRQLDHQQLPDDPEAEGLAHFSQLREFFDEHVERE